MASNGLVAVSATMAAVCLALVAHSSTKGATAQIDSSSDAPCRFATPGFLGTVLLGHGSTKHPDRSDRVRCVSATTAE